jgi:protein tyrosine/serine phosphatase
LTSEVATPTDLSRVLDWGACLNVRDLGGLRTVDGGRLRRGALVRSDLLCRLTDASRRAPVDYGIRTIVDVRFPDEVAHDWDRYPLRDWQADASLGGLRYLNLPFNALSTADLPEARELYEAASTRGEINKLDIDYNQPSIAAIIAAIADAQPGGVLVHCHGGKDRTGMVVGLILALLGVPEEAIADDYALSNTNLEPILIEWLDGMGSDPAERNRLRVLATPSRDAMLDTLAHVRAVHGSGAAYLRAGGLTDVQVARLRGRLLE